MEDLEKSLDKIFEEASLEILAALFKEWNFVILEQKIQHTGTQHGFDVFIKIRREPSPFPLNLFIECKHSQRERLKLPVHKLVEKSSQLNWAGFTQKDFHIFFSAVVDVSGSNQETGIENDDYPFIIIDWMRMPWGSNRNLIMELFYTYTGDSDPIRKYREFLLEHFEKDFTSAANFSDIAGELQDHFHRRIENYYAAQSRTSDFYFFSSSFLDFEKKRTDPSRLPDFYTHTNSNIIRLLQVAVNDFYIPTVGEFPVVNDKNGTGDLLTIDALIDRLSKNAPALLKILSSPGQGKSTFLLHIARTLFHRYHIFYLARINDGVLDKLVEVMKKLNPGLPLILVLDNTEAHEDELAEHITKWVRCFYQNRLVFITAERNFRYRHMERAKDIESPFEERYTLEFTPPAADKEKIFTTFIQYLDREKKLGAVEIEECRRRYLDAKLSTADSAFQAICYLKKSRRLENYKFDWEDWEHFVSTHKLYESLDNLFLRVATFYQFGIPITDIFYAGGNIDLQRKVNQALGPDVQLPISKKENAMYLRHESIAGWYFHEEGHESEKRRQDARVFFMEFLKGLENEESKTFFIKVYRKREFRDSFLGDLIDDKKAEKLLVQYLSIHPEEIKGRTELGKVYQKLGKWEDAERVLKESIKIDNNHIHARTELGKVYQKMEKWGEAERVLKESIDLDNHNIHARTELGKVYQKLEKWEEAERVLKESIDIDNNDIHARTELGKVYQKMEKWEEAERILKEAIEIDNNAIHARTELGKVYQKMEKWGEAERVLKESIDIDNNDIHARTELGKVYQKMEKWSEAERVLKEIIDLDNHNIHSRTELGKVYQNLHRWEEAEKVLKEAITIAPQNIPTRVVLGRLYYRLKEWYKCHNTFQGIQITKIKPYAREEWANALVKLGNRTCNTREKRDYFKQAHRLLSSINPKTKKIADTLAFISWHIGK